MDEVTPIKGYRDNHVAHPHPPTFPGRQPVISIGIDRHEVLTSDEAKATGDVADVLPRYVNASLDYLETVPLPFDWPTASHEPEI